MTKECPCIILDLTAPEAVLRERVMSREAAGLDPSEAGVAVLARQLASQEPLTEAERVMAIRVDARRPRKLDELLRMVASNPGKKTS